MFYRRTLSHFYLNADAIMLPGFEKIVEERIREAQKKGLFDDLQGSGKPIMYEDDRLVPEELRLAYRVLKNSGFLPPEIELKKEILRTEDLLTEIDDAAEKYRLLKRLNFLILKLNTMRDSSIQFDLPQLYLEKLATRFGSGARQSNKIPKKQKA
jgi:hypothetical protein